jgi:hypothetical protein
MCDTCLSIRGHHPECPENPMPEVHTASGLTCVHMPEGIAGLCPVCAEEWEEDPAAYVEMGDHPAGLRRWQELQEEMAVLPPPCEPDPDIPF